MLQLRNGEQIAERYRLERRIGSGGMATVWLAEDTRLHRRVAVKLLSETLIADPTFVRRFEQEARLAARLTHPNLVTVLDLGTAAERPYLVMEHVEGESLADRLERDPGGVDTRSIAAGLLAALGHIHSAGIVHRDVKPANVLLDERDEPRLTDFGIARMLDESGRITRTGQVLGTLRYIAPEITEGAEPTPRSDLYSLGVLIAEAGELDPSLATLVDRLRDPDPGRRPPSAEAASRMLAGDASRSASRPLTARTARPARSTSPTAGGETQAHRIRRPRRWLAPAAAILAGLAIAIGAIALTGDGEDAGGGAGAQAERGAAEDGQGQGAGGSGEAELGSEEAEGAAAVPAPATDPDPARGARLNDRGFALLGQGRPEEAIPVLRRAVASFPEGTDDLNYAYALFNLGRALRLADRPGQAVPVLERRLEIENQRPTVRQELRLARAEAG